jgi:hypothetical protein
MGNFFRSALYSMCRHFNVTLIAWVMRKYKRFKGRRTRAGQFLEKILQRSPKLFAHWRIGMIGGFT